MAILQAESQFGDSMAMQSKDRGHLVYVGQRGNPGLFYVGLQGILWYPARSHTPSRANT